MYDAYHPKIFDGSGLLCVPSCVGRPDSCPISIPGSRERRGSSSNPKPSSCCFRPFHFLVAGWMHAPNRPAGPGFLFSVSHPCKMREQLRRVIQSIAELTDAQQQQPQQSLGTIATTTTAASARGSAATNASDADPPANTTAATTAAVQVKRWRRSIPMWTEI